MTRFVLATALLLIAGCGPEVETEDPYVDEMAEQHADDMPSATPIASEPAITVDTSTVQYATVDGEQVSGYMAVPAQADSILQARGADEMGALPAVIVIHEWWGLNDNIRQMTRKLAGEGYRALAVDLYGGQVAEQPEQARTYMQQARDNPEASTENLTGAYEYLTTEHDAPSVASLGWCFGGGMSLRTATALPQQLDAAVIYYGHVEEATEDELEPLQMPILGIFGAEDSGIPVEGVRDFEQTLDSLGKDVEIQMYEGAGHAFANPSGQNYVEEAANDAWQRTVEFLQETLWQRDN